ncbi:MAG: FAD-dependent oxidoreductase, partial [Chloroflexota bacterium]
LPLGGLLGLRSGVPGNAEFGRAVLYFGERLVELGVSIVDEPPADANLTVDCRPAPEIRPAWARGKGLLLAGEVLGRDLHEMYGIGRRVAVVGPGALAGEVALFLAGWGRRPTVIVPGSEAEPFPDVHPMHAARLRERLDGYHVTLVAGARPLAWHYDENRKSQLRVHRHGREELLGPFHSAICAAGWPGVSGQRSAISGQEADDGQAAVRWPVAVTTPDVPAEVRNGLTLPIGDTPYPEPLRDLVGYAHLLGRVV